MSDKSDQVRKTAIDVMKKGGIEMCQTARTKHLNGEYLTGGKTVSASIL